MSPVVRLEDAQTFENRALAAVALVSPATSAGPNLNP